MCDNFEKLQNHANFDRNGTKVLILNKFVLVFSGNTRTLSFADILGSIVSKVNGVYLQYSCEKKKEDRNITIPASFTIFTAPIRPDVVAFIKARKMEMTENWNFWQLLIKATLVQLVSQSRPCSYLWCLVCCLLEPSFRINS